MQIVLWCFALVSATYAYYRTGSFSNDHHSSPLVTLYEWKYFDYVWDSPEQRQAYINSRRYNASNMIPIDVDRSNDGRTFVTVIRDAGVPASVHTVSDMEGPSGPLLRPYPDWSWYENTGNCNGITSVYRVAIDKCNRMWVLDTGIVGSDRICPAQLLVFNLYNDRLLFRGKIPDNVAQNKNGKGLLVTPIVETYGSRCEDTTVYMADVEGHGLVIYDGIRTFRLEADVFDPEENNSNFDIAGESFFLDDGVLGMALSPNQYPGESRYLYFRPLASRSLYAANTRDLRHTLDGSRINYYRGNDVLPSQASAQAFSADGTLFYGLTSEIAIGCWNMNKPLKSEYFKIAVQDRQRLQFTSGMKVISNYRNEYLLMMTNRLQKVYAGTLSLDEVNFRVLEASVRELLIHNPVCDQY
ncbi:major royal jelly protein-like 4 precursor [Nasonia vitripennis]|uniref:Bee-milk protein n=1 Tax=Nasonia vitripennis TaxID=7425 RepID=A0A7M6URJ8_NASVI|nr:major royal jelly protein-like 4 precursor [Nasonia vitripennis]